MVRFHPRPPRDSYVEHCETQCKVQRMVRLHHDPPEFTNLKSKGCRITDFVKIVDSIRAHKPFLSVVQKVPTPLSSRRLDVKSKGWVKANLRLAIPSETTRIRPQNFIGPISLKNFADLRYIFACRVSAL